MSTPATTRLISETANSSSSAGSLRAASAAHMNVRVRPGAKATSVSTGASLPLPHLKSDILTSLMRDIAARPREI